MKNCRNGGRTCPAETPGKKWKWTGEFPFCVSSEAFTLSDRACQTSSLRNLVQIDTGNAQSFYYWLTCPNCIDRRMVRAAQQNIPFLEGLANYAAPLNYRTNDWQDVGPVDIQYGVSRSPFSVSINGNQVTISTRLSYWLSVSHTRVFGRTGLGSCGVDEAQPTADVTVTAIFGITTEGKLVSKTRAYLSFPTRCNLTIFDIDATPYIQQVAQPQLDRLAATIDSRIGEIDVSRVVNERELY